MDVPGCPAASAMSARDPLPVSRGVTCAIAREYRVRPGIGADPCPLRWPSGRPDAPPACISKIRGSPSSARLAHTLQLILVPPVVLSFASAFVSVFFPIVTVLLPPTCAKGNSLFHALCLFSVPDIFCVVYGREPGLELPRIIISHMRRTTSPFAKHTYRGMFDNLLEAEMTT